MSANENGEDVSQNNLGLPLGVSYVDNNRNSSDGDVTTTHNPPRLRRSYATMNNTSTTPTSVNNGDLSPPPTKKIKCDINEASFDNMHNENSLQVRLADRLSCIVCMELKKKYLYQCTGGHVMCSQCAMHILSDCRLLRRRATCPACRARICMESLSRSLTTESILQDFYEECCNCKLPILGQDLEKHERSECALRNVKCKYATFGCQWSDVANKIEEHEQECIVGTKMGLELLPVLETDDKSDIDSKDIKEIFRVRDLSSINLYLVDVCMKLRHNNRIPHLYYISKVFRILDYVCYIVIYINFNEHKPRIYSERKLSYKLFMENIGARRIRTRFFIIDTPTLKLNLELNVHEYTFTSMNRMSDLYAIPIGVDDCNKFIAALFVHLRFGITFFLE